MILHTDALILVVDDDPASLKLSQQVLAAAGYWNIHLFSDPRGLMEEVDLVKVDLIISDLHMPELDGMGLLMKIKESVPEDEFLPVLVVTADATAESKRKALALGADDFLTKPIDVVEMTLRINHLLQLRKLHTALSRSRQQLAFDVAKRTSELETAMHRLESLIKAKDVFIASVSHELRTPLTAVLGFSKELEAKTEDMSRAEVAAAAGIIAEQATDLSAIIDDLLVAARSDINAVQVLREPVDLSKELNAVVDGLNEVDRGRIQLPSGQVMAEGDRLRIRQILRNLLNNALRHGGENIKVELLDLPLASKLTVIDDGAGVPPEALDQLFEPYYHGRGDAGKPPSIGIGLTVSRFLARLMEGDIRFVPHPDGTAFELSLPKASS
jgi:signal transduction histidine kinase